MEEGIATKYFDLLGVEKNTGLLLARFFCEVFEKELKGEDVISMNRAKKIYGEKIVFYAILDMAEMEKVDLNNYIMLLFFFCKKRLQLKNARSDAFKLVDTMSKKIEKLKQKPVAILKEDIFGK